ncbi:uncharacterized protein LOC128552273 [Mercenaria mercenaria]|uniref:uncharacterized protein LOC128552273 n=1 Tax=Mercenaria mercenaria TaxID=6596 RepID=UPI00234F5234|nr:uncharacterized protein LOC128552273 [Mercenaria mercenaria]
MSSSAQPGAIERRRKVSRWLNSLSHSSFPGKRKPSTLAPTPVPKPTPRPTAPKPKFEATPKTVPERQPASNSETDILNMMEVIEGFEGIRLKAYDAQPNNPKVHDTTIGIGHNLNRPDAEETFAELLPDVDFEKVKSGEQEITEDEARTLFKHDIIKKVNEVKELVGNDVYNSVPSDVKTALVNARYRGDLTEEVAELINEGNWEAAGKKYLEHDQYKNAEQLGIPGVIKRMDWNKEQFDTMIEKVKPDPK